MKKLSFLLVMVVVLVALMAGTAFATRYDSGYASFSGSPHGGYSTATTKCSACHAVHNPGGLSGNGGVGNDAARNAAMGTSEVLLRSTIANACLYCHVSNTFAIKTVYAENTANYLNPDGRAHGTNGGVMSNTGVNCTDCHQVHGAASMMANINDLYMTAKILKAQPAAAYDGDAPAYVANNPGLTAFQPNMTRWCTGCHTYYESGHNNNSHIMNVATAAYNNPSSSVTVKVAWADSTDCRSCHQNGVVDQAAAVNGVNNYPHFTNGFRFLNQASFLGAADATGASVPAAGTPVNDGACLICHQQNAATGAGQTF